MSFKSDSFFRNREYFCCFERCRICFYLRFRAAHGVILVTTKRGKEGKVKLSYDGTIGFQDRAVRAEQVSAREYMTMVNEALVNSGGSIKYSEDDILATERGDDPYNHSYLNWANEVYKPTYITQHTLNLTGVVKSDVIWFRLTI